VEALTVNRRKDLDIAWQKTTTTALVTVRGQSALVDGLGQRLPGNAGLGCSLS
jgi:hypothetical protein